MIRTKGEAGTGDVVEAVRHQRAVMSDIRRAAAMSDEELYAFAKEISAPYHLLKETARLRRLPVVSYVHSLSTRIPTSFRADVLVNVSIASPFMLVAGVVQFHVSRLTVIASRLAA
jgi:pyridoxal biosynthesis lyase PdxS